MLAHGGIQSFYEKTQTDSKVLRTFSQLWDKRTTFLRQVEYACMLPYKHFLFNETHILYGKIQDYYVCSFASNLVFVWPGPLSILIMTLFPGVSFAYVKRYTMLFVIFFQNHHHPFLIFHSSLLELAILVPNLFQTDIRYSSSTTSFHFVSSPYIYLFLLLKLKMRRQCLSWCWASSYKSSCYTGFESDLP